jgi:hypothetical protein
LRKIGQGILPSVLYGAKKMNMISTGAFLTEMGASGKQDTLVNKLVTAWEKKNSKTARAGGVSLMALSLAACGSSDDTSSSGTTYSKSEYDAAVLKAKSDAETAAAGDDAAAVTLALRNAATEAGATTFTGQSDAALIAAIKTSDNAGVTNAEVAALGLSGIATLAQLNAAYTTAITPSAVTSHALTTATDILNTGTADDTISASGTTFGSDDTVTDSGGADILKLSVSPTSAASTVTNLTGIETIQVTNTGSQAQTLVMTSSTGVTEVRSYLGATTGDVTFSDLQAAANVVLDGSKGEVMVDYSNSVVVGASDSVTVTIKNNASTDVLGLGDDVDEFETINISVGSGKNTITDIEDSASANLGETSKIVITGAGQLTLGETVLKDASEIDGSGATGKLLVTTDATVDKLTGGSADDTFTLTMGDFGSGNAAKTIDGGGGTDTISVAANIAVSDFTASLSGTHSISAEVVDADVATVAAGAASVTRAVDVANITGVNKVTSTIQSLDTSGNHDAILSVTGIAAGKTVDVTVSDEGTNTSSGAHLTVALEDASGAADSMTIDADGAAELVDLNATTDDPTTAGVETGGIETLTISSSDVNATTGAALTFSTEELEAFEVTTVNVTGSNKVTITEVDLVQASGVNANKTTTTARAAEVITFNAADATALFTLGTTEANVLAVTGGAGGIDVDINATGTKADVITGGSSTSDLVTILDTSGGATKQLTVTGVETIELETVSSGSDTHSFQYITGANTVQVTGDTGVKASYIGTEKIFLEANATGNKDFSNVEINVDTLTSTTAGTNTTFELGNNVTTAGLANGDPFDATVLQTDTGKMTIIDSNKLYDSTNTSNEFLNNAIDIQGSSSTTKVTSLVISGGGDTDTSTAAVDENTLTIVDNTNVALTSIDATGFVGNLTITGVGDLAAGSKVTMGAGDSTLSVTAADLKVGRTTVDMGDGTDTLSSTVMGATAITTYYLNSANTENFNVILEDDAVTTFDTTLDFNGANAMATVNLVTPSAGGSTAEVFDGALTMMGVGNNTTIEFDSVDTDATTFGGSGDALTINGASGANTITVNNKGATGAVTVGNGAGLTVSAGFTTATVSNAVATDLLTFTSFAGTGLTSLALNANAVASNGGLTMTALSAANLATLTIDSGIGAVIVTDMGTMNSLETFTVDTGDAAASAKTTITAGTSTSVDTITATGSGAFEITALTGASIDTIDASGVTGIVTIGSATAAVDTAAGATITTGTGNDAITLNTTEMNITNAGEKTSDTDNLIIVGAQNSGTSVINLASTSDQVVNLNGFAEANAQTNFESVNLSAVTSTGSYGFQVTANKAGSVILGTDFNDTIILGAGADDVSILVTNGVDTVTNYTADTDDIDISLVTSSSSFDKTHTAATNSTTAVTIDDGDVYLITGGSAGDADAKAAAATEITSAGAWTNGTAGDIAYFIVTDNNSTGVFKMVEAIGTEVVSTELTLVATFDGIADAAGDFIF